LAFANKIAVGASVQDFKTSFSQIVAVEGCKTACATQLLTSMGFEAASTITLSEKYREDQSIGLTRKVDAELDKRVPGIVAELVEITKQEE